MLVCELRPVSPRRLPLGDCLGLRAASAIVVAAPVPAASLAEVDGYAVDAASMYTVDGTLVLPAGATIVRAGQTMPGDCDAVVPIEHVQTIRGSRTAQRAVRKGDHIVARGCLFAAGEQMLQQGDLLGPRALGLLASVGEQAVLVFPRPRVAIVDMTPAPAPHSVGRRSLVGPEAELLRALVRDAGAEVTSIDWLPLPAQALRPTLEALADVDFALVSPGASRGNLNVVLDALAAAGRPIVRDPAILPAPHTSAWLVAGRPVLVLAGSLPDLLVGFEALGRPAIGRLADDPAARPSCVPAVAASRIVHHPGRTEFVPVALHRDGTSFTAAPFHWPARLDLRYAAHSNGLAVL